MKIVALMMAKDEGDVIQEWLNSHHAFFDELYVLDGGDDNLGDIVKANPKLKMYVRDADLPNEYKPIRDGARGYLFEKIREEHKTEQYWVMLAHPDEFYIDSPRRIVELGGRYTEINMLSYEFFLHESQRDKIDYYQCRDAESCLCSKKPRSRYQQDAIQAIIEVYEERGSEGD